MQYDNMELLDFLNSVENPLEVLINDYKVRVVEEDELVLLKYNQIDTPKCHLTNQLRGPILTKTDGKWRYVARGFYRFFNYGEDQAAVLDWATTDVLEKIDGSLIKVYYYKNEWRVGTNGSISASGELPYPDSVKKTFRDLFDYTLLCLPVSFRELTQRMDPEYTYLFELTSPYNRVVVPYNASSLTFLTRIENESGEEDDYLGILFKMPTVYKSGSLEECIEASKKLPYTEEGYVAVDGQNRRIKIKSPAYLTAHHIRGEGGGLKKYLELIRTGESKEFLAYFPEFKTEFEKIQIVLHVFETACEGERLKAQGLERREVAKQIEKPYMNYIFSKMDGKVNTPMEYFWKMSVASQVKYIEEKLDKWGEAV